MQIARIQAALMESLVSLSETVAASLPNLVGAVLLVLAGLVLARLARAALRRICNGILRGIDRRTAPRAGTRETLVAAIGALAYWLVFIVFLLAAVRLLDNKVLNEVLATVSAYLPHLVAATLIAFLGYLASDLAAGAVWRAAASSGLAYGGFLSRSVQAGILLVTLVVAIEELGVDSTFMTVIVGIAAGSLFGGAAIAFAVGAASTVSNLLASHYLQRTYQAGQKVRIGEIEGKIIEITDNAVVVETSDGRVHVPARRFSEEVSMLMTAGD